MMHQILQVNGSKRTVKLPILGVLLLLTGCASMNDGSLDYQKATSIPPLILPDTVKDPAFFEVLDIPKVQVAATVIPAHVKNSKGSQYVLPKPAPLDVSSIKATPLGLGTPSKPVLAVDGNGYPVLQIEGDANLIWDRLNSALKNANITVDDRNQSLGLINITFKSSPRQIYTHSTRLAATTITLQDNANTLSDKLVATDLLSLLQHHW